MNSEAKGELVKKAELLRLQLQVKRLEVEELETQWKEANRAVRGDWSKESYQVNCLLKDEECEPVSTLCSRCRGTHG